MARYWSTPIKRVASNVAKETRVVLAVRRQQRAGNIGAYIRTSQSSTLLGFVLKTPIQSKYSLRSPGLGSMTLKVDSAKERGVSRRPITRLLAARFTTNLGIKAKMNTMEIVHYKQGNWGDRKTLYAEYCR